MKKVTYFFSLAIVLIGLSGFNNVSAQGRGHKYGHDKDKNDQRDHDNRDRDHDRDDRKDWNNGNDNRWSYGDHDNRNHNGHYNHRDNSWERRGVRHYYHTHDRYCNHQPVVVHHYVRPRYIYYRDYDVYYDCQRSVYISYYGGAWTISAGLPFWMRNVNVRTASRWEVDYWDDNLSGYLQRRRPTCGREYFGG